MMSSRSYAPVALETFGRDQSSGLVNFHLLNNLWTIFLAAAGILDILAYVLPDVVNSSMTDAGGDDEAASERYLDRGHCDPGTSNHSLVAENDSFPDWYLEFVCWLDRNSNGILLLFSLLWLANSYCYANKRFQKALMEEERRLLFKTDDDAKKKKWWKSPELTYCISLTLQCLFLPVGLYVIIYGILKQLFGCGEEIEDAGLVEETQLSVIGAIVLRFSRSTMRAANAQIDVLMKIAKGKAIKTLLGRAIRNPFKFRRNLKEVLTALRWIKYLHPLIDAGNKIVLNTLDMLRRQRMRAHAKRVKRAKRLIWENEKRELTRDSAAVVIQSAFRAYLARKQRRGLLLLKNEREHRMASRLQRMCRRYLEKARGRVAARCRELTRLARMRRENAERMSDDEKRTMYQLRDELDREARELLNRKLLLRPNTKFAVMWKAVFVAAVLSQITWTAVVPLLRAEGKKEGLMAAQKFVADALVPTRVADLAACLEAKKNETCEGNFEDIPWYCREPIARWQGGFRDAVALALIPAPVSEWSECREKRRTVIDRMMRRTTERHKPWYCLGSHPASHAAYRTLVDVALRQLRYLPGAVMFLDVFVTFFTGRFHGTTGELVPSPWFLRWIVPGLALQLALNPNLVEVSRALRRCLSIARAMGPYRAYRHVAAVGIPLAYGASCALVEWLWLPMVSYENSVGIIKSPFLKSIMPY